MDAITTAPKHRDDCHCSVCYAEYIDQQDAAPVTESGGRCLAAIGGGRVGSDPMPPLAVVQAAGTAPATHRDDCSTCQCDYWDQQERLIGQVVAELAATKNQITDVRDMVVELTESVNDEREHLTDKINNAWRVLADMQARLGGVRA